MKAQLIPIFYKKQHFMVPNMGSAIISLRWLRFVHFRYFQTPEKSGLTIVLKKPIEFKSLKYYLNSFQNVEIFQEYVKSWICNGLNLFLDPE